MDAIQDFKDSIAPSYIDQSLNNEHNDDYLQEPELVNARLNPI